MLQSESNLKIFAFLLINSARIKGPEVNLKKPEARMRDWHTATRSSYTSGLTCTAVTKIRGFLVSKNIESTLLVTFGYDCWLGLLEAVTEQLSDKATVLV